jgi:hypothetical protein
MERRQYRGRFERAEPGYDAREHSRMAKTDGAERIYAACDLGGGSKLPWSE